MHSILRKRVVKAAGSAMDVFPVTDYSDYVADRAENLRIASYWTLSGTYLNKALSIYSAQEHTRTLEDGKEPPRSKKSLYWSKSSAKGQCSA